MVRERIKELVDFATTESPYRDANKGWLTDDVYLQLGKSQEKTSRAGKELANVSVFWGPINQLVSIIFFVVSLAAILVFISVSFAHGRFQIPIEPAKSMPEITIAKVELQEKMRQEQSSPLVIEEVAPIAEGKIESESTQQTIDFAAAALGGQKYKS